MKFGGTLIDSPEKINRLIEIINKYHNSESNVEIILIISAINEITDKLLDICNKIRKKEREAIEKFVKEVYEIHLNLINTMIHDSDIREEIIQVIKEIIMELENILRGMVILGETTPKSQDHILSFGERLSTPLIASILKFNGFKVQSMSGKEAGILTDSNFGEAKPLMDTTKLRVIHAVESILSNKTIPVIAGFIAADQNGNITTLGRGGSDYSATIIGASLNANEVWLWSDVDGLMTADPNMVKNPEVLDEISFFEAMEMSMFGSKYMHPRALEPVMDSKIKVIIKNFFNENKKGTKIVQKPSDKSNKIVKSITSIRHIALIDVSGGGMIGTPGTAAKIFDALAKNKVNIMMISQSPSESSISMIVKQTDLEQAITTLELNFLGRLIKRININDDVAIITVVGSGMRGIKGVAARVFGSIAKENINVIMITQGSSELNLSFVINNENCEQAVQVLYSEFINNNIK